jgi:hypothetical protein
MTDQQVDVLFFPEHLGFSDNQIFDSPPGIADVVGDASGAVRDVPGFFENGNLQIWPAALGPAGSTHTGRIAADNNKIHGILLSV